MKQNANNKKKQKEDAGLNMMLGASRGEPCPEVSLRMAGKYLRGWERGRGSPSLSPPCVGVMLGLREGAGMPWGAAPRGSAPAVTPWLLTARVRPLHARSGDLRSRL